MLAPRQAAGAGSPPGASSRPAGRAVVLRQLSRQRQRGRALTSPEALSSPAPGLRAPYLRCLGASCLRRSRRSYLRRPCLRRARRLYLRRPYLRRSRRPCLRRRSHRSCLRRSCLRRSRRSYLRRRSHRSYLRLRRPRPEWFRRLRPVWFRPPRPEWFRRPLPASSRRLLRCHRERPVSRRRVGHRSRCSSRLLRGRAGLAPRCRGLPARAGRRSAASGRASCGARSRPRSGRRSGHRAPAVRPGLRPPDCGCSRECARPGRSSSC